MGNGRIHSYYDPYSYILIVLKLTGMKSAFQMVGLNAYSRFALLVVIAASEIQRYPQKKCSFGNECSYKWKKNLVNRKTLVNIVQGIKIEIAIKE